MSDLFKEKAQGWDVDAMKKRLSSGISSAIVKYVSLHEDMHVMDFGAGTGLISSVVLPFVKKITAVDTSTAMLDKLKAKKELREKVDPVCQDITENPLGQTFDMIMSAMAIHHVDDTDKLIHTFANHSKPGTILALADLDTEEGDFHPEGTQGVFHDGFDRQAFQGILERHGFDNVSFVTAHSLIKDGKAYSVFLAIATKK